MKKTLILEIEAEQDKQDLCDLIGGRVWTMFDGKRDVNVRIASEQELVAIALANADIGDVQPNGHLEPGQVYGY